MFMDTFDWTVAILAGALAFFLILAIVFVSYLIKLMRSLNRISTRAEKVASNVESASNFFKQAAGPVAVTSLVNNIVQSVKDSVEDHKRRKKS